MIGKHNKCCRHWSLVGLVTRIHTLRTLHRCYCTKRLVMLGAANRTWESLLGKPSIMSSRPAEPNGAADLKGKPLFRETHTMNESYMVAIRQTGVHYSAGFTDRRLERQGQRRRDADLSVDSTALHAASSPARPDIDFKVSALILRCFAMAEDIDSAF